MKVLFVPKEVAGQSSILSKALRDLGVFARSMNFSVENRYGYHLDYDLSLWKYPAILRYPLKIMIFAISLFLFDTFHFHGGESFFWKSFDLPILKLLGKKIVIHLHGSEIRDPSGTARKNLRFLQSNSHKFIVATPDLLKFVPGAIYLPNSVDGEWFSKERESRKGDGEFVVVHAPTSRALKGTEYIIDACNDLKKKGYRIKLILLEQVNHQEIRKFYEKADVFVDQLLLGWYGVAAIENMAMGNPVMAYINPELRKKFALDLPIIHANKDNIEEVIEKLLKNREKLAKIGVASKEYAESNHHPKANARKLIEIYNSI
jgi:glycosyltransferase involved in cell wall biosynthesis